MIYLITENLSTLKLHKLTQAQYDRELAAGRIDANALYLTPDEKAPQPDWSQNDTGALDYIKNRTHYTEKDQDGSEIVHKLDEKYIPDSFAKTADIPTKMSQLDNDAGYLKRWIETDPTVPAAINTALNRTTSVNIADTNYTTLMARGTSLNSTETTPAVNGAIAWTYE